MTAGVSAPDGDQRPGDLRRQLGVLDAAAIYVGNILGSGIFVAPAAVAAAASGVAAGAGLWVAAGLLAACGALSYAECGARLPRTGGFYVVYRAVYGESVAFVGGWAALLVTYPASIAAIALVFAEYLGEVAPSLGGLETTVAAAALVLVAALNVAGVRAAAWAQRVMTGAKVAALAAACIAALAFAASAAPQSESAGGSTAPVREAFPGGWIAVLSAMVVLLWTYDGWSDLTMVAGEIRDPGRNLGRAVLLGMSVLIALYVTVQLAVGTLLTPERAAASGRVLAEAVEVGLGPRSATAVALLVVVTTFGSIHGIVLAASRLGFAMARDGVFLRWFGAVHPRLGTPARAVAALVGASIIYVFAAGFRNLLAFFSFSVWIFYGLTAAGLLVLRRRRAGEPITWRAPGGSAVPAVIIVAAACMTTGLMAENPRRSLIGLALLLAGFPVYAAWRRIRPRASRAE